MKQHLLKFKKILTLILLLLIYNIYGWGQILNAWNTNGLSGITQDGWPATTTAPNMRTGELSRGQGITASSLANGFSASGWHTDNLEAAKTGNDYFQFFVSPAAGYKISLSEIHFRTRRTTAVPTNLQLTYSLDGIVFTNIGTPITGYTNTDEGFSHPAIDLTAVSQLQNYTETITFRLYGWGASSAAGTFAFGRSGADYNDLTISGTTARIRVNIAFNVTDGTNPLAGALVNLNGVERTTNTLGNATFSDVEYALNLPYTVTLAGYHAVSGNVNATSDRTVDIAMNLIRHNVTFTVTHGINPVQGATITVSGQSPLTTNAAGIAVFNLLPGAYTYSVAATGFTGVTNIGFTLVNANLAIQVNLINVNIDLPNNRDERIIVYPNPSSGLFTVEIPGTNNKRVAVEILDITGKIVYRNDFSVNGILKETIDLQHLNKGMYFLRIREEGRTFNFKLIFR